MQQPWLLLCLILPALMGSDPSRGDHAAHDVPRAVTPVPVMGSLAQGGTFQGQLHLQTVSVDALGQVLVRGALSGTARPTTGVPTTIPAHVFTALAAVLDLRGTCTTMVLDVQPILLAALRQEVTLVPLVVGPRGTTPQARLLQTTLCTLARLQELPDEPPLDDTRGPSVPSESVIAP